jgi:hypothetical protein
MKLKHPANDNALEPIRSLWQRRLGAPATDVELRVSANVMSFFSCLAKWSRPPLPLNDNQGGRTGTEPEVH